MVDDWLAHTPRDVVAKNFGEDPSIFKDLPAVDPYILKANVSGRNVMGASEEDLLTAENAHVYFASQHETEPVPGEGGTFRKVDSTTFPIVKTISAAFVTLEPKGLRELHWHPNAEEWLFFHKGKARASVFIGNGNSRTFDFSAGDKAVFPDDSGHYIENTSEAETLE
ncbi:Cupin 1 [Macrophomina phaseolina MS6]|uniref:Cupin 1 n=1 Tax=Macrophomina phaseolina (strain MS6) TaxID=1126212 RepID=K2RIZ4_MACPH|nr:Cupin 1 [Macrophomina phaseolina MS6]